MDIDKLFKMPKAPLGGNKRRMPDNPSAEMLKRLRTDEATVTNGSAASAPVKTRAPVVRSEEEEEEYERSESFAPGGDADYFREEDEEGRMFGSGLTDEQKTILGIFESAEAGKEEGVQDSADLNIAGIRRVLLRFERAIDKNHSQRSKYPDDPSKFIDSEADLDAAIKSLLPLSQEPVLAYPELARSGTAAKLVELLSHENMDIVIDVIEVIQELTDEDVGNEGDEDAEVENEDEDGNPKEASLKLLIETFLENSVLELLVSNLSRLNESEEADRQGVFHTLGIFENVIAFRPSLSRTLLTKTSLLNLLLDRIKAKKHDENRGYASELLAIILQDNRDNRLQFGKESGVDTLLQVLSQYRKKDPSDADEVEFMENLFDALCSALAEPEIKKLFVESEGVELMVIMMKEKMLARPRSIKVLDYATSGVAGTASCEAFVDALGLKTLFSAFMGKVKKDKSTLTTTSAGEDASHVLGIISSLFSNIPSDSTARVRLLTKFVESEYEKVDKLLEIREGAEARLVVTNKEIASEKQDMTRDGEEIGPEDEDRWYLRKVDGGLFTLQTADYILAWICMEDDGVRGHVQTIMGRKGKTLKDIVAILKEYHDNITEDAPQDPPPEDAMAVDGAVAGEPLAPSQRDILEGLMTFLESC
ncbi:hypothetical protein FRB94_001034 [Tulasnella sp. JGI-2019a]|nr:hypothetical protein FRB94_001034 [Tulasnella sp. JGI-2019a]